MVEETLNNVLHLYWEHGKLVTDIYMPPEWFDKLPRCQIKGTIDPQKLKKADTPCHGLVKLHKSRNFKVKVANEN